MHTEIQNYIFTIVINTLYQQQARKDMSVNVSLPSFTEAEVVTTCLRICFHHDKRHMPAINMIEPNCELIVFEKINTTLLCGRGKAVK